MHNILVSICCITYNHEDYIRDALDSFLKQITNFKYEILIHDDASKDKTATIIKEYELRFPDIIKPIYQTDNQYSKGIKVGKFNRERALGKYLAICEGDDYWTDPYKLQKQYDHMRANPGCLLCVHAAKKVSVNKKTIGQIRPYMKSKVVEPKDVIMTSGNFIPTSSYFYRANELKDRPYFCHISPVGDYAFNLLCISRGQVFYMDEFMSAYRTNVPGSILYMRSRKSDERKADLLKQRIIMLKEYNKHTCNEYDTLIEEKITDIQFEIHCTRGDLALIKSQYKNKFNSMKPIFRIVIYLRRYFPKTYRVLNKVRIEGMSWIKKRVT